MHYIRARLLAFTITCLLIFVPTDFNCEGKKLIRGWVGRQVEKAEEFLGKPAGVMSSGAWEEMRVKLESNIKQLDGVMSKNITQFTTQLDTVLKAREDQLDSLLQRNISDLNLGLTDNIELLKAGIEESLASIRYQQSVFNETLWIFSKLFAQLALIVVTFYFIFLAYAKITRGGRFDERRRAALLKNIRFYLIVLVLAIFVVYLFKPIAGPHVDKEFEDEKAIVIDKVRHSFTHWLYKDANVNAGLLTKMDPANRRFVYGKYKAALVMELFLNSSTGLAGNPKLSEAYGWFRKEFDGYKPADADFYFLDACFKSKFLNSKRGQALAAISCLKYLRDRHNAVDDIFALPELAPLVYEMLNSYHVNPYDSSGLKKILLELNIDVSGEEFDMLTGSKKMESLIDTLFFKELKSYPTARHNSWLHFRIQQDRQFFHGCIEDNRPYSTWSNWISDLKELDKMSPKKYWGIKSLVLDDALVAAMMANTPSKNAFLEEYKTKWNNIIAGSRLPQQIKSSLDELSIFKRVLMTSVLKETPNDLVKAQRLAVELYDSKERYAKADSILTTAKILQTSPDSTKLNLYGRLVKLSAELNIFYQNEHDGYRLEPLSYYFISKAKGIPAIYPSHEYTIMRWKEQADDLLEQSYFSLE